MNKPESIRRWLSPWRRRLCEAVGIRRYSRLALDGLDAKLEQHLDFDGGFFVEAGANDGLTQSNTYYFERWRGWRGLLVTVLLLAISGLLVLLGTGFSFTIIFNLSATSSQRSTNPDFRA